MYILYYYTQHFKPLIQFIQESRRILRHDDGLFVVATPVITMADDRSAILIIKVKRVNPNIKIMVLVEDETDKTRVLEYGADEFAVKPISAESVVDKVYNMLTTSETK